MLTACGGSSGSSPPPTPTPTAQDLADAQAAKLTASLDAATKLATLSWSDTFPAGISYGIEQQGADGTWTQIDAVPGSSGSGSPLSWAGTTNVTTTFRISAQRTNYAVPLDTSSGNTSLTVTVPAVAPTIVLDQIPPISGTVNVSIGGGGSYSSVSYYVDLILAGTSTTGPNYSVPVNTSGLTTGSHLFLAQLTTGPDSYIDVRLPVEVMNPEVAVQVSVSGTSGPVEVNVAATSNYGITSVTASLDGNTLGTLTTPNGCPNSCSLYQFPVNATTVGSGSHTITAQATDGNGAVASKIVTVTFDNPPTINLTSPVDGALVNGNLQMTGTFGTDKPSASVSLNVTLGNLPILKTSTSPFSSSFSLAGVTPGTYTLTAIATDSDGLSMTVTDLVTVTSSPSLVYTPVFTAGAGSVILATSGAYILYSATDGTIHQHYGSVDVTLPLGAIQNIFGWTVTDTGYVFAQGFGRDRPGANTSIYMWPPGGAASNLSIAASSTGIDDQLLPVHYPWVLWCSSHQDVNWNEYVLYNVSTGQQYDIYGPSNATLVGNNYSDFVTLNGQLTLFYWAESGSATNVLRWDQTTNTSVQLTNDGLSLYPQTDGIRVAWQTAQRPLPPSAPYTLTTLDLASNTTQVLSTIMSQFQLSSGLLGWVEQTAATRAIKASDGTTTSTVSPLLGTVFFGSSGGYIVFEESGKMYAWSVSGGRLLLFDAAPGQVNLTGKTVYFTNGTQQVVYAVPLP